MGVTALTQKHYGEFIADPVREGACLNRLKDYLTRVGQLPVEKNAQELFALESGICDRFNYFVPRTHGDSLVRVLVSGCAVGSEMIIARRYGFQEVVGAEVVQEYVDIAKERLALQPGFSAVLYDGMKLDFADHSFSAVVSGHVIEHTPSPYHYLKEHLRILAPEGVMFLEFPSRYHPFELHTNLPSLEYMPEPMRSLGLRFRASRFAKNTATVRRQYDEIRRTLRPMSSWQIKLYLKLMGNGARVLHSYSPAPGFCRMLLIK